MIVLMVFTLPFLSLSLVAHLRSHRIHFPFLFLSIFHTRTQNDGMLKVRPGPQRKSAGFQAQIVCLTPWTQGTHPGQITALCINSNYGL